MDTNRERIEQRWRELAEAYGPAIDEARAELDEAEAEFAAARERRNAAVDKHGKIVNRYNDEWEIASKGGGR